jgi:hypothetical protein
MQIKAQGGSDKKINPHNLSDCSGDGESKTLSQRPAPCRRVLEKNTLWPATHGVGLRTLKSHQ